MPSSANNGQLGRLLSDLRARSHRRRIKRLYAMIALGLMLGLLVMLATGCASPPPLPPEPPTLPQIPVAASSMPTESFSMRAAKLFEKWQLILTAATASDKP